VVPDRHRDLRLVAPADALEDAAVLALGLLTDHTERWTNRYGRVVGIWPESAQAIRSLALKAFVATPGVERMLNRAQHTPVIGTERLTPRRAAAGVR
jgi:hypothetical protein